MKEIKIVAFEGSDPQTSEQTKSIEHQYKEIEVASGKKWWESLFENSGSILLGVSSFFNGNTMTQAEIDELNRQNKSTSTSFGTIFLYGGGAIIIMVIAYILIKRK